MSTFCIVGGGPSLRGFPWSFLDDKRVIAINRAFQVLPKAEIVYFSDRKFFGWYDSLLLNHPGRLIGGIRPGEEPIHADVESVVLEARRGLDLRPGHLSHGNNSGFAAINLAVQLGAKQIYLLGLDMRPDEDGKCHWHDGYPITNMPTAYDSMRPFFRYLPPQLKELGVEVVTVGPSALTVFPVRSRDEFLTCWPAS